MSEKFKLIPEAHVFLMNGDDEVLLLRRFNTGYEDGKYSVIAGHIDGNEEVRAAAIREAREEAGIHIEISDIEVVGVIHRKDEDERVAFFLAASRWSGDVCQRRASQVRRPVLVFHSRSAGQYGALRPAGL